MYNFEGNNNIVSKSNGNRNINQSQNNNIEETQTNDLLIYSKLEEIMKEVRELKELLKDKNKNS